MPEVINLSDESDGDDVVITDVRPVPGAPQRQRHLRNLHRLRQEGFTLYLPDGEQLVPAHGQPITRETASFGGEVRGPNAQRRDTAGRRAAALPRRRNLRNGATHSPAGLQEAIRNVAGPRRNNARVDRIVADLRDRVLHAVNTERLFVPPNESDSEDLYYQPNYYAYDDEFEDGNEDDDDDDDEDYYPLGPYITMRGPGVELLNHHIRQPFGGDDVPQDLMDIIQQREEQEFERKSHKNLDGTVGAQEALGVVIAGIKEPFTTKIDTNEDYVCCLCCVTLGEGIPESFTGNREHRPLAALQEAEDVHAPYRAMNMVTDGDRDLSKRIFMSGCGHTYCGRCVRNISSVKSLVKAMKHKYKRTDNDIESPFVFAPSKCVGPSCEKRLTGKKAFVELFL